MKQILNNYVVRSFALLCLLSFTLLLGADEGRIFNVRLISNKKVNCIVQDKKGFIWLSTNYGVNRYDGYNFVTYRYNKQDTTSIVDNEITTFLNDKEGRLWVGSAHGLMRYEAATNSFKRFSFPLSLRPRVKGIIEDAHGNIFVGTSGFGLFLTRRGSDHLESFIGNEVKPKSIFFDLIFLDEQGAIGKAISRNALSVG